MRRLLIAGVLSAIGFPAGWARPGEPIWLETERFDDYGGWTNDTQFVDQMGSPYLMAIGLGKPVADAVTHVPLPRSFLYESGSLPLPTG